MGTFGADYKTDGIIQSSLRTQLAKDVTVITVAHRLQTIMDADRIVRFFHSPVFLHGINCTLSNRWSLMLGTL